MLASEGCDEGSGVSEAAVSQHRQEGVALAGVERDVSGGARQPGPVPHTVHDLARHTWTSIVWIGHTGYLHIV